MYAALWRHLPGGWLLKSTLLAIIAGLCVALLFTVVFPWVEPRLPFTEVTVEDSGVTPGSVGRLITPTTPDEEAP